MKDSRRAALGDDIEADGLADDAMLCGRTLGRAQARSADRHTLAGSLGRAVATFGTRYADQTTRDWNSLWTALDTGRLDRRISPDA